MPTQHDIAASLRISRSLVSKVLCGHMGTTRVNADLRKKILKKASQLGYVPNRNASGLSSGKRGSIAVFVGPWGVKGAEFVSTVLQSISLALRPTYYHMWLSVFLSTAQFRRQMDIREMNNRVDGILVGGRPNLTLLPLLRKVEKAGIPVVTFFGDVEIKSSIPNVSVNNRLKGRLGPEHLILRGCRRIAHFYHEPERLKGYKDALRAAGLPFDPRLVVNTGWEIENGRSATQELLARRVPFDGIAAQSDYQAYGALQELLLHGLRVPEDVRLIGVDDSPLCMAGPILLSTVTSEVAALGREAVDLITRKIAGETVHSRNLLPKVIQRHSS